MFLRAVVLLAEADVVSGLDERAHRRLGERARARMRRAAERHGGAVVELPPGAILALWTSGDPADALRGVRAAETLRESLGPLNEGVTLRAGLDVVDAPDVGALLTAGLGPIASLAAAAGEVDLSRPDPGFADLPRARGPVVAGAVLVGEAARAMIGREAIFGEEDQALLIDGSRSVPVAPDPTGDTVDMPALSFQDGEPPLVDLPDMVDEKIASLFNARAWDQLRALFAEHWTQIDNRGPRFEHGWSAEEWVGALRTIAAEAPDAEAVVQRRSADGNVALGVLRISGHRGGRPFETAHALLTIAEDDVIQASEIFAVSDRNAARERFDFWRGAPPEEPPVVQPPARAAEPPAVKEAASGAEGEPPAADEPSPAAPRERVVVVDHWARHEAQLARFREAFDAHDVDAILAQVSADFVQVDHRAGTERDRDAFGAATADSLEMVPDLRAEVELLVVDGDRRLARISYAGEDVDLTTFVVARLEGDLLVRQDVFSDDAGAREVLAGAPAPRQVSP